MEELKPLSKTQHLFNMPKIQRFNSYSTFQIYIIYYSLLDSMTLASIISSAKRKFKEFDP